MRERLLSFYGRKFKTRGAKRRSAFCLLLFLFAGALQRATALDSPRLLRDYHHTTWDERAGVNGRVLSLAQTKDGFLWVGTSVGLYRFDGLVFEPWLLPPSAIAMSEVNALLAADDGSLWVGYRTGVAHFSHGAVRVYNERDGLPYGRVRSLARTGDGSIWAAVIGGFSRLVGEHWNTVRDEWGYPEHSADSVFVDRLDTLWVGTGSRIRYLPSGAKGFRDLGIRVNFVPAIRQGPDGTIWFSDGAHDEVVTVRSLLGGGPPQATRIPVGVWSFLFDRQGALWMASEHGVRRIPQLVAERSKWLSPNGRIDQFDERDGLSDNFTSAVFEDAEGNIWVGTSNGLDRFRYRNTMQIDLGANRRNLFLDRGGDVLAASTRDGGDIVRVMDAKKLYTVPGVLLVADLDRDGLLWVSANVDRSSRKYLLLTQKKGVLLRVTGPVESPQPYVTNIGTDSKGTHWISVSGFGEYTLNGSRWNRVKIFDGADADLTPDSQYIDEQDRIWLTYYARSCLVVIDKGNIRILDAAHGLNVGAPNAVAVRRSAVWIAGATGLAMYDGASFHRLVGRDGYAFPSVVAILPTDHEGLWLEADDGVIQIFPTPVTFGAPFSIVDYRKFDTDTDFAKQLYREASRSSRNAVQGGDGKLWFLTKGGVAFIDPARLITNQVPPPVSIRSMSALGQRYGTSSEVTLPPSTQNISFDYTALSLTQSERNQFRYQLVGLDRDWQDAKYRRQAFYTNLSPGRYTFRVIASNNDGVWNQTGASFDFIIRPTFIQTIWFRLLCLAAFIMALVVIFVSRVRHVEDRVRSHLSERLVERERIARELHDTLLQGFQGLMLRFQTATIRIPWDEPARGMMESALDRADEVLLEGRRRITDLRTESALSSTLVETMRLVGDDLQIGREIHFSVAVNGADRRLHSLIREEVYQVGREAVVNAFLHSGALDINVEISFEPGFLLLCVRDNGCGINSEIVAAGKPGHFGLSGMRERAKAMNASFSLQSGTNVGTSMELSVPARIAYAEERNSLRELLYRFSRLFRKRRRA